MLYERYGYMVQSGDDEDRFRGAEPGNWTTFANAKIFNRRAHASVASQYGYFTRRMDGRAAHKVRSVKVTLEEDML